MMRSPEIDNYIKIHFSSLTVKEIANKVGLSLSQVYKIAYQMGLKSDERKSLVGKRFGDLLVLSKIDSLPKIGFRYKCLCDCGKECIVSRRSLKSGNTKSCGCKKYRTIHGDCNSKLYHVYHAMKDRCNNPNNNNSKNYGDRGISICNEWNEDYLSFKRWAINNGYQVGLGLTIDRIDVNGDYCPENCRWVNQLTQCNNMRSNRYITHNGKTQTIAQWARELGEPYDVLRWKVNKGTFPPKS